MGIIEVSSIAIFLFCKAKSPELCAQKPPANNFIKKRFQRRYFPVNLEKFLRTPSLKNICERLLLCTLISLLPKTTQCSVILKVLIFDCPLDAERKLQIHKMFRRYPGQLLKSYMHSIYILCPGDRRKNFRKFVMFLQYLHNWL